MFGIGWNEITILMTVVTFILVWVIVIASMVVKLQRGPSPSATVPAAWSRQSLAKLVRWNFSAAVFVVGVLAICTPFPWLLFGNSGMPFVKIATIGLLLAVLYTFVSGAIMLATNRPVARERMSIDPARSDDTSTQAYWVARITQRFCPRCRAPLAADAPEGLCPACLMAGGLASAAVLPVASGMAVTTPPSGSQSGRSGPASAATRNPRAAGTRRHGFRL
jgi:hypothetical protein